jgi:hypothetical protein
MSDERLSSEPNSRHFASETEQCIQKLRNALAQVIESLPGQRISRPAELGRALDLDSRLAWKISKVVGGTDPFAAARYMPGSGGVREFLRAAKRKDASDDALVQVQQAYAEFRKLIRTHAGDRKSFDMMMAGHARHDRGRADLEHRKGVFQHLSYLWGVQARTQVHTFLLHPSEQEGYFDAATLRGFVDLRRIRPHVPWRIMRSYTVDDAGEKRTAFQRHPLEIPEAGGEPEGDLPLLREYCSKPLPQCRRVAGPAGQVEYQLVEGAVGNTGLITLLMGEMIRAAEPRYRDERHRELVLMARLRTPCEILVFDLLVHTELFGHLQPSVVLYSDLFADELNTQTQACDRMPVEETVECLGTGLSGIRSVDIPRYQEMISDVFTRLGWDAEQFEAHRLQVVYPMIPTSMRLVHQLPPPPPDDRWTLRERTPSVVASEAEAGDRLVDAPR